MKIIQKVQVKQIITENSKQKLRDRLLNQHMQLEQECQQLLFEQRKVQNKTKLSKREVTRRFQEEIDNRQEKINMIEFKMKQLEMLEIGSEIVETEVEALVEVTRGMQWDEMMKEKAIVVKDGVVVRIDE
ncbi:MAG TPA: YlqD family protein [Bacillota bacterium]|nr:YlqD family protein [Bacillota bacterium]